MSLFVYTGANVAMPNRRRYSTVLAEFPWYSNALVENPASLLANLDELPGFEVSIISFRIRHWLIFLRRHS